MKKIVILFAAVLPVLWSCSKKADKPFIDYRGVILCNEELFDTDTSVYNWIDTLKMYDMNTVSLYAEFADHGTPEYLEKVRILEENGFAVENQTHGMSWLLPRDLFAEHPEYFRVNKDGERVSDYNGCPSCPEALAVVRANAKILGSRFTPTNHRYYFWMHDGGDKCHCEKCENMNLADQALLFENAMIAGLREIDPEAKLAHLAYDNTTPAPICVKPAEGIFLEYAPIDRCHERPLTDLEAGWAARPRWKNGDYVQMLYDNLKVFDADEAMILDYWIDDSLFSNWHKPQTEVYWDDEVFLADLEFYTSLGIHMFTTYGVYIDADYKKMFDDVSCVSKYCAGLRDFAPSKNR